MVTELVCHRMSWVRIGLLPLPPRCRVLVCRCEQDMLVTESAYARMQNGQARLVCDGCHEADQLAHLGAGGTA